MDNQISILIVEDEEIWLESISRLLTDLGFFVVKAVSTVEDALVAFADCEYDLILMDISIDGRNSGIELGKIVNKLYKKPFIFITASNEHNLNQAAAAASPSAYLPKPVNPSSLFVAIQNAISNFSNDHVPSQHDKQMDMTSFFVKNGSKYKKIDWVDIAFLTTGKNYVSVFNVVDKNEYLIRSSLQKTMKEIIPKHLQQQFVQVNRAEVVQIPFIQEVMADEVRTAYKSFAVSDSFSRDLKSRLRIIS